MATTKYRPIRHVHITDDLTGELLADVDAPTTADGLAYYLSSRHIDESATEASVMAAVEAKRREPRSKTPADETISFERRAIGTGVLEVAIFAHVEEKCEYGCTCPWAGNRRWATDVTCPAIDHRTEAV